MEKKLKKRHGREIKFSSIKPLELWKRLELEQPSSESSILQDPISFEDDESRMAYEAFKKDFCMEGVPSQDLMVIPAEKGSIFVWALLKEISERCPKGKLSSKKLLFTDVLLDRIRRKTKGCCRNADFSEKDFEDIILYLEKKKLVHALGGAIRMTQHLTGLLHNSYHAWLGF